MVEIVSIQKAQRPRESQPQELRPQETRPQETRPQEIRPQAIRPKETKERLVQKLHQEIGGVVSYWRAIPVEELRALDRVLQAHPEAKPALISLVDQLKQAKATNSSLNRHNFGLAQTAAKHERVADRLTQANAMLEKQKNELLRQIRDLVGALTHYEDSEIRRGVIQVRNLIAGFIHR